MKKKSVRSLFKAYLDHLTSAAPYYDNARSLYWFKGLHKARKKAIYAKLKAVDPKGCTKLKGKIIGLERAEQWKRKHKFIPSNVEVAKQSVLVEQEKLAVPNFSVLRYVPMDGMKKAIALVRAAGYTPDETAAIFNMKPEDINAVATPEAIKAARREVPDAVRQAADAYVLHDLMKGEVSENTERADRISARRAKVVLEVSAESRALQKEDEMLEKKREEEMANRFKVDRKNGQVIDVVEEKK